MPEATREASTTKSRAKLTLVIATRTASDPKPPGQRTAQRPPSPFVFPTWYRFQMTSALAILHRITGIGLALGSIALAWWLIAVDAGGELFAATHAFIASPIGMLLLFGWSIAFFYHLCNGIRHLVSGTGHGLEPRTAYRSGHAVIDATVLRHVRQPRSARDWLRESRLQRLTAVALIPLSLFFAASMLWLATSDRNTAAAWLGSPGPALLVVLFVVAALAHALIGLRSVLLDYVHTRAGRIGAELLVRTAMVIVASASVLAVLKLCLGR